MTCQNSSRSELYAYHFQNSEPKFYTRIPNIVDYLTYKFTDKKGVVTTRRLSVYAKVLYRIIRMIASDNNVCWYTTKSLAEKANCSVGSIVNAKKELLMSMDQLDGNPLIIEKRKMISKKQNDVITSKRELCTYTIFDIWRWNNAFMSTLNHSKSLGIGIGIGVGVNPNEYQIETDSCGESVPPTDSCGESVPQETDSCGEPIKNPYNNIPLYREQQPTAKADPAISSNKKRKLFPADNPVIQQKALDWLIQKGCPPLNAKSIAEKFSHTDIEKASEYLCLQNQKKKSKGSVISNNWAYLQDILNKRYWENIKTY